MARRLVPPVLDQAGWRHILLQKVVNLIQNAMRGILPFARNLVAAAAFLRLGRIRIMLQLRDVTGGAPHHSAGKFTRLQSMIKASDAGGLARWGEIERKLRHVLAA
jgi:hypothetical protein